MTLWSGEEERERRAWATWSKQQPSVLRLASERSEREPDAVTMFGGAATGEDAIGVVGDAGALVGHLNGDTARDVVSGHGHRAGAVG